MGAGSPRDIFGDSACAAETFGGVGLVGFWIGWATAVAVRRIRNARMRKLSQKFENRERLGFFSKISATGLGDPRDCIYLATKSAKVAVLPK